MSSIVYVSLLLGAMAVMVAVTVPAVMFKKCGKCGIRNGLDATACKGCANPFPEDRP